MTKGSPPPPKRRDITGIKFGRLVANHPTEERHQRQVKWLCECDCGGTIIVRLSSLIDGDTQSCGCLSRETNKTKATTILRTSVKSRCIQGTNIGNLAQKSRSDNTSGTKGVSYNHTKKRWAAYIGFAKKIYFLGSYAKKKDAVLARKKAEREIYGDFLIQYLKTHPQEAEKLKVKDKLDKIMKD